MTLYTIKSTKAGKAKLFYTIQEVLDEVSRVLCDREGGMQYGRIVIEAKDQP